MKKDQYDPALDAVIGQIAQRDSTDPTNIFTGDLAKINALLIKLKSGALTGINGPEQNSEDEDLHNIDEATYLTLLQIQIRELEKQIEELEGKIKSLGFQITDLENLLRNLGIELTAIDQSLATLDIVEAHLSEHRYEALREKYGTTPNREQEEANLIRDENGNAVYIMPAQDDENAYLYRLEQNPETGELREIRYDAHESADLLRQASEEKKLFANETWFFNQDPDNWLARHWMQVEFNVFVWTLKGGQEEASKGNDVRVVCDGNRCWLEDERGRVVTDIEQAEAEKSDIEGQKAEAETELGEAQEKLEEAREEHERAKGQDAVATIETPEPTGPTIDYTQQSRLMSKIAAGGPMTYDELLARGIPESQASQVFDHLENIAGYDMQLLDNTISRSVEIATGERTPGSHAETLGVGRGGITGDKISGGFNMAAAEPKPAASEPTQTPTLENENNNLLGYDPMRTT